MRSRRSATKEPRMRFYCAALAALMFAPVMAGCSDGSAEPDAQAGGTSSNGGSNGVSGGGSGGSGSGGLAGGTSVAGAGAGGAQAGSGGSSTAGTDAGGSGAGGSGGPVHVAACDGLAEVGVWEAITPAGVHIESSHGYGIGSLGLDPLNAGIIYMGTQTNVSLPDFGGLVGDGVWKSEDCGSTWIHVNSGTNGDKLDNGRQWTLEIDSNDSNVLYTNAGYGTGGLYKSTNAGVDWADITPKNSGTPGFVGNLQMDPEDPEHLLLTWHASCGPDAWGGNIGCFSESTDAGASWQEIYGTPTWDAQVRVYLLHGSTWIVPDNGALLRTTDAGDSWDSVADLSGGGHSAGGIYRATNGDYYIGTEAGMLRSPADSDGASWSLVPDSGSWIGGITGDGTSIFSSTSGGIRTSAESDGLTWTVFPSSFTAQGNVVYDASHHLLYASWGNDGIWRVRTE